MMARFLELKKDIEAKLQGDVFALENHRDIPEATRITTQAAAALQEHQLKLLGEIIEAENSLQKII